MMNCLWFGDWAVGYNLHDWCFVNYDKDGYQWSFDFLCFYVICIYNKEVLPR